MVRIHDRPFTPRFAGFTGETSFPRGPPLCTFVLTARRNHCCAEQVPLRDKHLGQEQPGHAAPRKPDADERRARAGRPRAREGTGRRCRASTSGSAGSSGRAERCGRATGSPAGYIEIGKNVALNRNIGSWTSCTGVEVLPAAEERRRADANTGEAEADDHRGRQREHSPPRVDEPEHRHRDDETRRIEQAAELRPRRLADRDVGRAERRREHRVVDLAVAKLPEDVRHRRHRPRRSSPTRRAAPARCSSRTRRRARCRRNGRGRGRARRDRRSARRTR